MTRVVVFGLMGQYPMGGMAWQVLHHLLGFQRLQCDVFYIENSGAPPYSSRLQSVVASAQDNIAFLDQTFRRYGLSDAWAYYDCLTKTWAGMAEPAVTDLLQHADVLVNVCGSTLPDPEARRSGCLIYIDTDPGLEQIRLDERHPDTVAYLAAHDVHFTYGWNIGTDLCPLPATGMTWRPTHPPVLTDLWQGSRRPGQTWRSIATYRNRGKDFTLKGSTYLWSKHTNFELVMDLPSRVSEPLELALVTPGPEVADRFLSHGWAITDPYPVTKSAVEYSDYIREAKGEFSVEKDSYVRVKSGWFSDRTVCFLASGRPCVVQDTGFGQRVPCGRGLLAWQTLEEAAEALRRVGEDYASHAKAAADIAREYFDASIVLPDLLDAAGVSVPRRAGQGVR